MYIMFNNYKNLKRLIFPILILLFVPISFAYAGSFDATPGNLTETITAAQPGDIINLAAGNYTDVIPIIDKDLIINGSGFDTILKTKLNLQANITVQNLQFADFNNTRAIDVVTVDTFVFDNLLFQNLGDHAMLIWDYNAPHEGDPNVTVKNSRFVNTGINAGSHPADMKFFQFNGTAKIENVTINKSSVDDPTKNDNVFGIEFRGFGCETGSSKILLPETSVESVIIKNVTISGAPNKHALLIQCYSDVTNFSLEDLDLSGITNDDHNSIYPTSVLIGHNGTEPFQLGNTLLRGIMVSQTGNVNATNSTFVGAADNFAIENIVTHGLDSFSLNTDTDKPTQGLDSTFHVLNTRLGGIVTWVKDNFFVPENTGDLQLALARANENTTVNIEGFVFTEATEVNEIQLDADTPLNLSADPIETPVEIALPVPVTVEQEVVLSFPNDQPIKIINTAIPDVVVTIPDNTLIQASNDWNGQIEPPKVEPFTGTAPVGFVVSDTVIEVGSPDTVLIFNASATLVIDGVTGDIGYKPSGSSQWIQIVNECSGTFASPGDPEFPGECFISNGSDTKIVTFHFTSFGGLSAAPSTSTAAAPPTNTLSSGGSGNVGVGPSGGKVSMDRITGWASDYKTFRFAVSHLIKDNSIDAPLISTNGKVPTWMLQLGEFWHNDKISDQEFFNAVKYLIKNKLLK